MTVGHIHSAGSRAAAAARATHAAPVKVFGPAPVATVADGAIDVSPRVSPLQAVFMLLGGNVIDSVGDFAAMLGIPRQSTWAGGTKDFWA